VATKVPRYNPFMPGKVVHPAMFAGRVPEIREIERILNQTKNGNPEHFLIHGERGIGKSSLLLYAEWVASGRMPAMDEQKFHFLVVPVELEANHTHVEIIRKLANQLRRSINQEEKLRVMAGKAWDFLKRWEVMGVKYASGYGASVPEHELLDEFLVHIEKVALDIRNEWDGILIMVDEADKPAATANLGLLTKLVTERLSRRDVNSVCLGLAGLTNLNARLRESHESAPRIFCDLPLPPLAVADRKSVVNRALKRANEKNEQSTTITPEANERISDLSEGYPAFVQEFGYWAFESDTDYAIDEDDVRKGAVAPRGALHQLGQKYFQNLYFEQIQSEEYRKVLHAMSEHGIDWVTKDQIRKKAGVKESILTNALATLRARNIIIPRPGQRGHYRLPSASFAVWIHEFTGEDAERIAAPNA
jgi:hypothetical protein